jgi:putative transposase
VGWELSDTLDTAPVLEAVRGAIEQYGVPAVINSDQGSQFTSDAYIGYLKHQDIRQIMDGKARWVDNVVIERWFRSLKTEYVYINEYTSPRELRIGVREYIRDYNQLRPHQTHDYATPEQVYREKFTPAA